MDNQLTWKEIKSIQLEILAYIDSVCRDNNIEYWLDGGTLLGAVKYNGYIPWDDDIDLSVRRKDYYRLLKLLDESSNRFQTLSMYKNDDYHNLFAKVVDTGTSLRHFGHRDCSKLGVFVDIFPLDSLPDNKIIRDCFTWLIYKLRAVIYYAVFSSSEFHEVGLKDKTGCLIGKLFGRKRAFCLVDCLCRTFSEKYDKYIVNIVVANVHSKKHEEIRSENFAKTVYREFEGKEYPVPIGYHNYLTLLYGDYMAPYPKEKQVTPHDYIACRL